MIDKRMLLAATLAAAIGCAGAALAESKKQSAPGQTGENPGQTYNTQRESNPDALSPGQQFNENRATTPDTPPPGAGVQNYGDTQRHQQQ